MDGRGVETAWRGERWKKSWRGEVGNNTEGRGVETTRRGEKWKHHGGEMGGDSLEGRGVETLWRERGGNIMEGRGVETSWVESARRSEALKGRERPSSVSSGHTRNKTRFNTAPGPLVRDKGREGKKKQG